MYVEQPNNDVLHSKSLGNYGKMDYEGKRLKSFTHSPAVVSVVDILGNWQLMLLASLSTDYYCYCWR